MPTNSISVPTEMDIIMLASDVTMNFQSHVDVAALPRLSTQEHHCPNAGGIYIRSRFRQQDFSETQSDPRTS